MRYEWLYSFTSNTLKFDKTIKYGVTLQKQSKEESMEGFIEIRPGKLDENQQKNSGTLMVSIPMSVKEGTPIANRLAHEFAQRMAFEYGDFNISWAVLTCERIPETPEEIDEVGELTHHLLRIALITVPEKQDFEPTLLDGITLNEYHPVLLQLFNDANNKENLIDKYLTRFKIVLVNAPDATVASYGDFIKATRSAIRDGRFLKLNVAQKFLCHGLALK